MVKYLVSLAVVAWLVTGSAAEASGTSMTGEWAGHWKIHGPDGFNVPVTLRVDTISPGRKAGTYHVTGVLDASESYEQTGFKKVNLTGKIKGDRLIFRVGPNAHDITNFRFVMQPADQIGDELSGKVNGRFDRCPRSGKLHIARVN